MGGRRRACQHRAAPGGRLDRLSEDWNELITDGDALTTLVVEVTAALLEVGLPLYDGQSGTGSGGVCLTPAPDHRGVLATRIAWLGEQLLADAIRLDHLSIQCRAKLPRQPTFARPRRPDEHHQHRPAQPHGAQCSARPRLRTRFHRFIRGHATGVYLGGIVLLAAGFTAITVAVAYTTPAGGCVVTTS